MLKIITNFFFLLSLSLSSMIIGFKEQIYDVYRYLPPQTQVKAHWIVLHTTTTVFTDFVCRLLWCRRQWRPTCWKWRKSLWRIRSASSWNAMNWRWKASNSSLWRWRKKSGNSTRCATCTTRSPSHRRSSFATHDARYVDAYGPGMPRCWWVCVFVLGWLVDGEDARRQLHCGCHARRNAARRTWRDHDVRSLSSTSHCFYFCIYFVLFRFSSFRSGENRVLITTDVWARGIDVQQVSFALITFYCIFL